MSYKLKVNQLLLWGCSTDINKLDLILAIHFIPFYNKYDFEYSNLPYKIDWNCMNNQKNVTFLAMNGL